MTEFAMAHPWLTFFMVLAALGAVRQIAVSAAWAVRGNRK
jgi:hypothetical protein